MSNLVTEPRVLVAVPTYNEAQNVELLAQRVLAALPEANLLIVDDNSPDGTAAITKKLGQADERVHLLLRTANRGYARSSEDGFAWALARDYDFVITMDGDLSHDPALMPAMLKRAQAGADLVIGSRYTEGGGLQVDWSPFRRAVSQMGSRYARMMIGIDVQDCTSGYRCYRATTLAQVPFESLQSDGYSFLIEMLSALSKLGATIEEYPIVYIDRERGESKISKRIIFEALIETTRLGWRRALGR